MGLKEFQYTDKQGNSVTLPVSVYPLGIQRETFCRNLAAGGMSEYEAYCHAYEKIPQTKDEIVGVRRCAMKLAGETAVILRVQELSRPVIKKLQRKLEYTVIKGLEQADEAYRVAFAQGNPGAMLKAVEMQAKLSKLLTETVDINHRYGMLDDADTQVLLEMRKEFEVRRGKRKKLLEVSIGAIETVSETPIAPSAVEADRVP